MLYLLSNIAYIPRAIKHILVPYIIFLLSGHTLWHAGILVPWAGIKLTSVTLEGKVLRTGTPAKSCPTLCDPKDCSPPGSSVHGILQARTLEWVAICSSGGASGPRDWTQVSHITGRFFTTEPGGSPLDSTYFFSDENLKNSYFFLVQMYDLLHYWHLANNGRPSSLCPLSAWSRGSQYPYCGGLRLALSSVPDPDQIQHSAL